MKEFIKKFLVTTTLIIGALSLNAAIVQAGNVTTPHQELIKVLGDIKDKDGNTLFPDLVTTGQHPDAPADFVKEGVGSVTSPIYFALDLFRFVVSGIAFIIIIIASIKLVSTSTEEEAGKAKESLLVGIIGLLVIQLADPIVKKMFFGEQGEAFEDIATAQLFAEDTVKYVRGIIGFVELFAGSVSVFMIVTRGFLLITSAGNEEEIGKAKTHIIYGIVGLVVVVLAEVIVRGFVFPEAGEKLTNINAGKKILIQITNYLAGFISIFAFAGLFYAGYRYVVSGGNEEVNETVKKTFFGSIIALILALGSFAFVNTFITLDNTEEVQPTPEQQDELPSP
ncbi:hypothetical protein HY605_03565 [Candidatus Peregrinibacteria bacterium]|nr:hypothetical protein [Candidatus Peregrinibacteria bacterium]